MMAEQLKKHAVTHKLFPIKGGEHGLAGGDLRQIDVAYEAALAFINQHMGQ